MPEWANISDSEPPERIEQIPNDAEFIAGWSTKDPGNPEEVYVFRDGETYWVIAASAHRYHMPQDFDTKAAALEDAEEFVRKNQVDS